MGLFGIMALAIVKVSSEDKPDGSGNEVAPQQEKSDNQSGNSLARFLLLHRRQASQFLRRQSWGWGKEEGEEEKEEAEENNEEVVETMCRQEEREYREPRETANENDPYFQVNLAKRNRLLAKILFVLFINPTFSDRILHINVGILKL